MAKIMAADVFVAYDTVQFTRAEFHARQRLKNRKGESVWLSIPVVSTGHRQVLKDVRICEAADWRADHLRFLESSYGQAPHFSAVFGIVAEVYDRHLPTLVEHNMALIQEVCRYLGSETRMVRASTVPHAGDREQRVLDLVRNTGGRVNLTSTSTAYDADWSCFQAAGVPVMDQVFRHPVYEQQHGAFIADLGIADLLFAEGQGAAAILRACHVSVARRPEPAIPVLLQH